MEAQDLMSTKVVAIDSQENLLSAMSLMQMAKVHHLPVLRDGKLMGILADEHLQLQSGRFEKITAGEVCERSIAIVRPDTELSIAIDALFTSKIGVVSVIDYQGRLAGIITANDLRRLPCSWGSEETAFATHLLLA